MNTNVLPRTYAGDITDMADEPKQEQKTWLTEVNRWAQVILVLAGMFVIGLPIEHRLTAIELKTETANTNWIESVKIQKESNSLSLLSLQTSQTVLEILIKMKIPRDDRRKAQEKLAEIKAKKISQATGNFAGGDTAPPE